MEKKTWTWIAIGVTVMVAGAAAQVIGEAVNVEDPPSKTVRMELRAPGDSVDATVIWTAPEGTRRVTGELPLMNTSGTEGVSYDVPRGTPVSITVTNHGGMSSRSLGFAGTVACAIWVDGRQVSHESAKGFHSVVKCEARAD